MEAVINHRSRWRGMRELLLKVCASPDFCAAKEAAFVCCFDATSSGSPPPYIGGGSSANSSHSNVDQSFKHCATQLGSCLYHPRSLLPMHSSAGKACINIIFEPDIFKSRVETATIATIAAKVQSALNQLYPPLETPSCSA